MNTTKLIDHKIEFVFENCECIQIEAAAIKHMYFSTIGEKFIWDAHEQELQTEVTLKNFYITLDVTDKKNFHHSAATMLIWGGTDSIITDGEKCINRLRQCDDITHVYINGVCYRPPWHLISTNDTVLGLPIHHNDYQHVSEITTSAGDDELTIDITAKTNNEAHIY